MLKGDNFRVPHFVWHSDSIMAPKKDIPLNVRTGDKRLLQFEDVVDKDRLLSVFFSEDFKAFSFDDNPWIF